MAIFITRRTTITRDMEAVHLVTSFPLQHPDERVNQTVGIQCNDADGTTQEMVIGLEDVQLRIDRRMIAYDRREQGA